MLNIVTRLTKKSFTHMAAHVLTYYLCVRVAQLKRQADYQGRRSLIGKSLQKAFNPKFAGFVECRPKFGGRVYHNNILGTLRIHLCPF